MSEEKRVSESKAAIAVHDPSRDVAAVVLAWVWPGLGHLYLRRRDKGLILMGALVALFVLGIWMKSGLQLHMGLDDPLAILFTLAQMGIGAPYLLARLAGYGLDPALVRSASFEYGNTFSAVAGLLNILVMLDAFDIARGRKR